jgi:isopentenyl-diphosphate delta-isomerase
LKTVRLQQKKDNILKKILNYIGQMRIYSVIDICIFAAALTSDWKSIVGVGILWASFLLYLENQHQDELRLHISQFAWLIGIFIPFLLPIWLLFMFAAFAFMYTKKKRNRFFGYTSPIWRGLQNAVIAYAFMPRLALLALTAYAIRNFIGDLRDAGGDYRNRIQTLPVRMGFRRNQGWAFYGHLACVITTTIAWSQYAGINEELLVACILIQLASYPMTPRTSNPPYLNFYEDDVIIVDQNDAPIGQGKKYSAHQQGLLHRAFSVFVFNDQGKLLLQKRASSKYHSGGLWSNTCCGHPRPGETTLRAAHRRMQEEMGFDCVLLETGVFAYIADLRNGLYENEIDHVFIGRYGGPVNPNHQEVDDYVWEAIEVVAEETEKYPEKYTPWFRIIVLQHHNLLYCTK